MAENKVNKDEFHGMSDRESAEFQLSEWVGGRSLHNTIRDECCPDFSCCNDSLMPEKIRLKFAKACKGNDLETQEAILFMSISEIELCSNIGADVHIASEENMTNH